MNTKGRIMLRIIAGGYLVYLGIDIIRGIIGGNTDQRTLFLFASIAFIVIGGLCFALSIKQLLKGEYEVPDEEDEPEEENTQEIEENQDTERANVSQDVEDDLTDEDKE